jgi:hypothetical protein
MSETINWLTASSHWSGSDGILARLIEHIWYSLLPGGVFRTHGSAFVPVPLASSSPSNPDLRSKS